MSKAVNFSKIDFENVKINSVLTQEEKKLIGNLCYKKQKDTKTEKIPLIFSAKIKGYFSSDNEFCILVQETNGLEKFVKKLESTFVSLVVDKWKKNLYWKDDTEIEEKEIVEMLTQKMIGTSELNNNNVDVIKFHYDKNNCSLRDFEKRLFKLDELSKDQIISGKIVIKIKNLTFKTRKEIITGYFPKRMFLSLDLDKPHKQEFSDDDYDSDKDNVEWVPDDDEEPNSNDTERTSSCNNQ